MTRGSIWDSLNFSSRWLWRMGTECLRHIMLRPSSLSSASKSLWWRSYGNRSHFRTCFLTRTSSLIRKDWVGRPSTKICNSFGRRNTFRIKTRWDGLSGARLRFLRPQFKEVGIERVIVTPIVCPHLIEFWHSEHWAEITLRQHQAKTIAMLCFN